MGKDGVMLNVGQCLCGRIRYAAGEFSARMAHCHCSMCRKFHGAAFATFGSARQDEFRWLAGGEEVKSYRAGNGTRRLFCPHCGSSLAFISPAHEGTRIEVALGTLDTDIAQRPDAHIFVGAKANWVTLCDGLPRYSGERGSEPVD